VWVELGGSGGEVWHLNEDGATFIWTGEVSSMWQTGYECWYEFDILWVAENFGSGTDQCTTSWP
jgi:hypothetical protein